eukprot:m.243509 g.243509  ORF g.243509 m.243509 type:complete len:1011 (-) comp14256_c0_seq1:515-3547(-)
MSLLALIVVFLLPLGARALQDITPSVDTESGYTGLRFPFNCTAPPCFLVATQHESTAQLNTFRNALSLGSPFVLLAYNVTQLDQIINNSFTVLFSPRTIDTLYGNETFAPGVPPSFFVPGCLATLPTPSPCVSPGIPHYFIAEGAGGNKLSLRFDGAFPQPGLVMGPVRTESVTNLSMVIAWSEPPACSPVPCTVLDYTVWVAFNDLGNGFMYNYIALNKVATQTTLIKVVVPATTTSITLDCPINSALSPSVTCLTPYTVYSINITARSSYGSSSNSTLVLTQPGTPSLPPTGVYFNPLPRLESTANYVVTGFKLPTPLPGPVLRFLFIVTDLETGAKIYPTSVANFLCDPNNRFDCYGVTRISSLYPYVMYNFSVSILTALGQSDYSLPGATRTLAGTPAAPVSPRISLRRAALRGDFSVALVNVSWGRPAGRSRGPILQYMIIGEPLFSKLDTTSIPAIPGASTTTTATPSAGGTIIAIVDGNTTNITLPFLTVFPYLDDIAIAAVTSAGAGLLSDSATLSPGVLATRNQYSLASTSSSSSLLSDGQIAAIVASCAGLILIVFALLFLYARHTHHRTPVFQFPPADKWDIARERIHVIDPNATIWRGQLGTVFACTVDDLNGRAPLRASVKIIDTDRLTIEGRNALVEEVAMMKRVDELMGPNVLRLLYTSFVRDPMLFLLEPIDCTLKDYLRSRRLGPAPETEVLLQLCADVSKGMASLAGRNMVHGDLASRNIFVCPGLVAKVGLFHHTSPVLDDSRDSAVVTSQPDDRPIPVRWMAPESLTRLKFDTKTDVFSFGVLMWEVFTLAELPYQDLTNQEVRLRVVEGLRLNCPSLCGKHIYAIMTKCWALTIERPPFDQLHEMIAQLIRDVPRWNAGSPVQEALVPRPRDSPPRDSTTTDEMTGGCSYSGEQGYLHASLPDQGGMDPPLGSSEISLEHQPLLRAGESGTESLISTPSTPAPLSVPTTPSLRRQSVPIVRAAQQPSNYSTLRSLRKGPEGGQLPKRDS